MAEEPYTTKVKVLANFHEFAGMDDKNEVEIPTHLVQPYASLGIVEMPAAREKKLAAKEAK